MGPRYIGVYAKRVFEIPIPMTVRGNSVLKPSESSPVHSLFLPRFVEIRTDKTKADTLAQVLAQFDAAVTAAQAVSK